MNKQLASNTRHILHAQHEQGQSPDLELVTHPILILARPLFLVVVRHLFFRTELRMRTWHFSHPIPTWVYGGIGLLHTHTHTPHTPHTPPPTKWCPFFHFFPHFFRPDDRQFCHAFDLEMNCPSPTYDLYEEKRRTISYNIMCERLFVNMWLDFYFLSFWFFNSDVGLDKGSYTTCTAKYKLYDLNKAYFGSKLNFIVNL